jgi:hypothetical protein
LFGLAFKTAFYSAGFMDTLGAFFKVILLHAAPKDSLKAQEHKILGLAPDRLHMYILKEQYHEIYFKYFSKFF